MDASGKVSSRFFFTGDSKNIQVFANGEPEDRRSLYLAELAATTNNLPWSSVDPEFIDPGQGEGPGLSDIYTALDTTELEGVETEDQVRD